MDPTDQHAAPTRAQGPNGVSVLDRSRDGARLSLRDPHPGWPLAAWSLPCPPPPRGGDGRPWWQGWCLSSVTSEADTCASPQEANGLENEHGAASCRLRPSAPCCRSPCETRMLGRRRVRLESGHCPGPAGVWPHPRHGIASPGLSFPVTACAQTGLRDSQDLPGRFWPPRPAAPSARL